MTKPIIEGRYIFTLTKTKNFIPHDGYKVVIESDEGFIWEGYVEAYSVKAAIEAAKIKAGIK